MLGRALPELRTHPVEKRVRAVLAGVTIVDSTRARLVWEPRRVIPSYAVPAADIAGRLVPWDAPVGSDQAAAVGSDGPPVLDPRTPFSVHTAPGSPLTVRGGWGDLPGAAFQPADPDLDGYVVLDWDAFSQWTEEDEPVMGHPHDPFSRIDCLRSSRHVVIAVHGQILADSRRPTLLFETGLPARYYLPREDVRQDLLVPSDTHTVCAYKGVATYWSARAGDTIVPDLAWAYEDPLHDATPVAGLICFYGERVDLTVDGVAVERPATPWS
ncbi:DUF427 domain-containing protein [Intrasporangium sp. DVR]